MEGDSREIFILRQKLNDREETICQLRKENEANKDTIKMQKEEIQQLHDQFLSAGVVKKKQQLFTLEMEQGYSISCDYYLVLTDTLFTVIYNLGEIEGDSKEIFILRQKLSDRDETNHQLRKENEANKDTIKMQKVEIQQLHDQLLSAGVVKKKQKLFTLEMEQGYSISCDYYLVLTDTLFTVIYYLGEIEGEGKEIFILRQKLSDRDETNHQLRKENEANKDTIKMQKVEIQQLHDQLLSAGVVKKKQKLFTLEMEQGYSISCDYYLVLTDTLFTVIVI